MTYITTNQFKIPLKFLMEIKQIIKLPLFANPGFISLCVSFYTNTLSAYIDSETQPHDLIASR